MIFLFRLDSIKFSFFQILDFNFVQASVEHIKKIHDQAEKVSDKKVIGVASMWSGKMDRGPIDLLQRYSDILTNAFMALQYCPFQNTVPVALQTCLFMSKKILEALEALEKKEWTHEKIATTVSTINNYIYHHIGNNISYRYISYFPYIKLFSYYIHTSTGC